MSVVFAASISRARRAATTTLGRLGRIAASASPPSPSSSRRYSSTPGPGRPSPSREDALHPALPSSPTWSTSELLNPRGDAPPPIDAATFDRVAARARLAFDGDDARDRAMRGMNDVLTFVRAMDDVDVADAEPMWTPHRGANALSSPLRADVVATRGGGGSGDGGGGDGWAAADREKLMAMAPDASRAPYYVAPRKTSPVGGSGDEPA